MAGTKPAHDPPRDQRVERVRLGICETIVPFDLHVGEDEDRRVEIHSLDLGMVRIVCASGGLLEGEVPRTPRPIRRSDPDMCKIDVQLRGRGVLEHIPARDDVLRTLVSALKPGGRLLVEDVDFGAPTAAALAHYFSPAHGAAAGCRPPWSTPVC